MTSAFPYPLATTDWLGANLDQADLRVVDASWRMPGNPAAISDHRKRRIPGSVFFDLDAIADQSSGLPHMLPSPARFAEAAGALGISDGDRVLIYDDAGVFSAARVWWTFRAMGHERASVLDGGLPKWLREGRTTDFGEAGRANAAYGLRALRSLARQSADVRAALQSHSAVVLDARPSSRFSGDAPEPRAGLRSGHMPGARNLPHGLLLTEEGTMKPADRLREVFTSRGVNDATPVIATCGSGVTAAVIALALEVIGHGDTGLYDGSWAEWGRVANDPDLYPVSSSAHD
jgi:thiosulfate/3-mercaptopyruvate sulfurtransferase